ncbi:uncharacterized protein E0L32_008364 [Thyridium curvatum]|uniref:Uncharacterized protein n=1 Tax=Thyridium curvatum TaxID=1093900 RepID=A0A507B254_9PEZI|nr:uncharacterized protein E0L32_008364 [Thyridium curvatum]TPX10630.1 hypothetical protein E0L32_008364 [Thyridium curvatum]
MPARTNGSVATAPAPAKTFELPALDFNFSSLTEGTNIPAPLPSPIQEEPALPKTPTKQEEKENTKPTTSSNGEHPDATSPDSTGAKGGVKRPADDIPASPTHSHRQGSIRRLFSRNMLNSAYASGEADSQAAPSIDVSTTRPASRSNGSFMDDRKSKRSSGWFRRLRGGDTSPPPSSSGSNKRSSTLIQEVRKPAGPPPPMIPELSDLEAKIDLDDGGSLGSDLFKNIK